MGLLFGGQVCYQRYWVGLGRGFPVSAGSRGVESLCVLRGEVAGGHTEEEDGALEDGEVSDGVKPGEVVVTWAVDIW